MKTTLINIRIVLMAVCIMLAAGFGSVKGAGAATDTYTALIAGDSVVDCNTAYFTIWIKSATGINFRTFQGTVWISNAFLNTSSDNVQVDWVAGTSDIGAVLNTHQIIPPAQGGITPGTGGDTTIIRLNTLSKAYPGALLTNTYQRIGQLKITRINGVSGCLGCSDIHNKLGWYTGPNAGLKTTFSITDWVSPFGKGVNITLPVENGTYLTNLNNQTPVITEQPHSVSVNGVVRTAVFSVNAISVNPGDAAPTYQWYDSEDPATPLSNSSLYSGATTSTLTITNPEIWLNGHTYFAGVSQCNAVASNKAMLTVESAPIVNLSNPKGTEGATNGTLNTLPMIGTNGYTSTVNGYVNTLGKGETVPTANSNQAITSQLGSASSLNVTAYPNPAHDKLTISFNSSKGGDYALKISDIMGQTIVNQLNAAQKGNNIVDLDLGNYAKGAYMISVTMIDGAKQEVVKLIIE